MTAGLVVVTDQIVKILVDGRLSELESMPVVPGFFSLTRIHNTGTAFGLFNALDFPFKTAVLTLVGLTALGLLAWFAATLPVAQRLSRAGLALVLGGAIGNLIDRVRFGYVLDFFDFEFWGWHFWAFNIADAAITVGVGLMLLEMILSAPADAVQTRR